MFCGHCTVLSYINLAKLTLDNVSKTLWPWVFSASSVGRGVTCACVAPAQGFPADSSLQIMVQISSTLITHLAMVKNLAAVLNRKIELFCETKY